MTIYYVDVAVGNDANAGTAEGAGNAWASIAKGLTTAVAGDTVYVKASGTYSEGSLSWTNVGSRASPISVIGYTTTPGDNGRAVVVSPSSAVITSGSAGTNYRVFRNLDLQGGANAGAVSISAPRGIYWINCIFRSVSGNSAVALLGTGAVLIGCRAIGHGASTAAGIQTGNNSVIAGCAVSGASIGIVYGTSSVIYRTLISSLSGTTQRGTSPLASGTLTPVIGCTIVGNGAGGTSSATGVYLDGTLNSVVMENIIKDFSAAGNVGVSGYDTDALVFSYLNGYNCMHNNTIDYADAGVAVTWPMTGFGDVSSDPLFVNAGAGDFSLQVASPCRDAGILNPFAG